MRHSIVDPSTFSATAVGKGQYRAGRPANCLIRRNDHEARRCTSLADLLWACVPTMSQTRTQSFNLIPNRRDLFQVVCDSESVFPFHVFETVRRSLDDFGHKALDIIQVGL